MDSPLPLSFLCFSALIISLHFPPSSANSHHLIPPRREVYDNGHIYDITHKYVPSMPVWESKDGLGKHFLWLEQSMKNGSLANSSVMRLGVHTGTHVDAPSHFFDNYLDAGFDVDSLDLQVLNGIYSMEFTCPFF